MWAKFIQIQHLFIQEGHTKKRRRREKEAKKEWGTKRNVKMKTTEIALHENDSWKFACVIDLLVFSWHFAKLTLDPSINKFGSSSGRLFPLLWPQIISAVITLITCLFFDVYEFGFCFKKKKLFYFEKEKRCVPNVNEKLGYKKRESSRCIDDGSINIAFFHRMQFHIVVSWRIEKSKHWSKIKWKHVIGWLNFDRNKM